MKSILKFSFVILLSLLTIQSNFSQWQQTALTTGGISTLASTQTHIFALTNGVYSTTDNGANWVYANISPQHICSNNIYIYASGNSASRISRSTNNGANWQAIGLSNADGWFSMTASGNNIFASRYVIQRSTDAGENWSVLSGIGSAWMECMAANGTLVFALSDHKYLYRSTNNGDNWSLTNFPLINVNSVSINGSIVYTGTQNNGVYISTNSGESWSQTALNNQNIKSVAISGNNIFAGSTTTGVYYSNNAGATWMQKNEGLTNLGIYALLINGDNIYAGTNGAGVWKRSLSELVSVNIISSDVPNEYSLSQNYPNPFNPTTNIKFSLPVSGYTMLSIYDVSGRLISTLVNSELIAGTYKAAFEGSNIASGIYFYTLSSGDYVKTNKMILIK